MEHVNFSPESVLSGLLDIFNNINEKTAAAREKNEEKLQLLQNDAKALQSLFESLSEKDDRETNSEIQRVGAELSILLSEYEKLTSSGVGLRQQVDLAKQTLEELREQQKQKSAAVHPRARYSVNVYRDMSKINWHEDHEPNELKGFACSKTGLKTFCFDREKQSKFFISNSLWEMGEDESMD